MDAVNSVLGKSLSIYRFCFLLCLVILTPAKIQHLTDTEI